MSKTIDNIKKLPIVNDAVGSIDSVTMAPILTIEMLNGSKFKIKYNYEISDDEFYNLCLEEIKKHNQELREKKLNRIRYGNKKK